MILQKRTKELKSHIKRQHAALRPSSQIIKIIVEETSKIPANIWQQCEDHVIKLKGHFLNKFIMYGV